MNFHIDVTPVFKVGDPCPDGYIARQEWAEVHMKAGLKQSYCAHCSRWFFPHELDDEVIKSTAFTARGRKVELTSRICKRCKTNKEAYIK